MRTALLLLSTAVALFSTLYSSSGGVLVAALPNPQPGKLARLQAQFNCTSAEECAAATGGKLRSDPVQHYCNQANPCSFSTTPSYLNWVRA